MRTGRTLLCGILSPILAASLGIVTYGALTRASADRDKDFVFRTDTGLPATIEGAVRSGNAAARLIDAPQSSPAA